MKKKKKDSRDRVLQTRFWVGCASPAPLVGWHLKQQQEHFRSPPTPETFLPPSLSCLFAAFFLSFPPLPLLFVYPLISSLLCRRNQKSHTCCIKANYCLRCVYMYLCILFFHKIVFRLYLYLSYAFTLNVIIFSIVVSECCLPLIPRANIVFL